MIIYVHDKNITHGLNRHNLSRIAQEYGTPLYVYDGDVIIKKYQSFKNEPKFSLHFSYCMVTALFAT